jgi:membrane fusion protein, multidrug efflux system
MTKKPLILGLVAVALIALVIGARSFSKKQPSSEAAGDSRSNVLSVYTHTAKQAPLLERITATGTILADEGVELTAESSGIVTALNITEGARVAKGDLLVKINDAELRAELSAARIQVDLARLQSNRQQQLLSSQGASQEAYDLALNELRVRESAIALLEARIQKTEIRAPFDGTIGLRYVSPGAYLTPSTRVATLQSTATLKIDFTVPERYMDRLSTGGEVSVRVAGLADAFTGSIYAIEPCIDETTRTLRLRARAANPGGRVIPGAFATVEIPLREIPDAILVPAGAIIPGLNEKTVFVLEEGKAVSRKVETGLRLASDILVLSGLNAGDVVITSGQLQLRPGMAVKAVARASAETATPTPRP